MPNTVFAFEVICGSNVPAQNNPKMGPFVTPANVMLKPTKPPSRSTTYTITVELIPIIITIHFKYWLTLCVEVLVGTNGDMKSS